MLTAQLAAQPGLYLQYYNGVPVRFRLSAAEGVTSP